MPSKNVLSTYNVNVSGEGSKPMLFAHGLGCDQNVWKYISPAFAEEYKIIVFDFIGCGRSDSASYNQEKYASLNGYADDIIDICKTLNLENVIFVGHSVSCMIGLLAAIKMPDLFSHLIMLGPSPCYINKPPYYGGFDQEDIERLLATMQENYMQWSEVFAPKAMGNADRPELSDTLQDLFCKADPTITCEFAKVTFLTDNRNDLEHSPVPSLILQPADDIVAPQHIGAYLHQKMPNSTLRNMKATGHFPHLSAVEETISLIRQYLNGFKA